MGVVRNDWLECVRSLHVQSLMLTDVQTPFLRTPLLPLALRWSWWRMRGNGDGSVAIPSRVSATAVDFDYLSWTRLDLRRSDQNMAPRSRIARSASHLS